MNKIKLLKRYTPKTIKNYIFEIEINSKILLISVKQTYYNNNINNQVIEWEILDDIEDLTITTEEKESIDNNIYKLL